QDEDEREGENREQDQGRDPDGLEDERDRDEPGEAPKALEEELEERPLEEQGLEKGPHRRALFERDGGSYAGGIRRVSRRGARGARREARGARRETGCQTRTSLFNIEVTLEAPPL